MATERPAGPPGASSPGDRFDSWKEIAAYLGRTPRTVQRWERSEGLPVHRLGHDRLGSVYAYRSELDRWWEDRKQKLGGETPAPSTVPEPPPPPRSWRLPLLAIGLLALAAVAGYRLASRTRVGQPRTGGAPVRIAVLPFQNLSGDTAQDYVSDGFTEELITVLGRLQPRALAVIARTSVMRYKLAPTAVDRIGRDLDVSYVLEGSIRTAGEAVRIATRLVRVTDQTPLWSETYERPSRQLLPLEQEVARRTAGAILRELGGSVIAPEPSARPVDPAAHEAYLKGRFSWNKRTEESLRQSVALFQEASGLDPGYAAPQAGLADAYMLLANYGAIPAAEAFPKAEAAADRALALDPDLAEAHASRAFLLRNFHWDFAASEEEFQRAIALQPNLAVAHFWYGILLETLGRFPEARAEAEKARSLDPLSPTLAGFLAGLSLSEGRYTEAVERSRRILETDPEDFAARLDLGRGLALVGETDEAISELKRSLAASNEHPMVLATLGNVYARAGRAREAGEVESRMRSLVKTRYVAPYYWAVLFAGRGDADSAMRELEKVYQDRHVGILSIGNEPELAGLRRDPRFRALLRRVGLADLR